jgi:hypothetical protein
MVSSNLILPAERFFWHLGGLTSARHPQRRELGVASALPHTVTHRGPRRADCEFGIDRRLGRQSQGGARRQSAYELVGFEPQLKQIGDSRRRFRRFMWTRDGEIAGSDQIILDFDSHKSVRVIHIIF